MGESAVLFHSYSFAAARNDSHEDNTNHALSQSVSFGRFVTENLEWGKWSSFSHKKYVDEAEKFSQPGSVAQKKAFFEAHYKRIAEAKKAALDDSLSLSKQQQQQQPECVAGLLNTLDTLTKEEESCQELVLDTKKDKEPERTCVVAVLEQEVPAVDNSIDRPVVVDDLEEKESHTEPLKKIGSVDGKEKERKFVTKNSMENSETAEKPMEVVISQNISETSITHNKNKRPVRQRFSFFNFLLGNTKTQDQIPTRNKRKTDKKQNKPFLCLCFQPEMVGETEAPTKTQRRSL